MQRSEQYDAVVVGAGFAGLYMLYRLRDLLGLRVILIEAADGVGGTWYWNRYPGARCDIESLHYSYSFSDQLQQEWEWSEKYAGQPEILKYLEHVADRFDLKRDIRFGTRVTSARYDEEAMRWLVESDQGERISTQYLISAVGTLSDSVIPRIEGDESFRGETYQTAKWPREGVDFSGKRVGILGTGATGIQLVPELAKQAAHLYVFQRSATYSVPLRNRLFAPGEQEEAKARYREIRRQAWNAMLGIPYHTVKPSALADDPDERQRHYRQCWEAGNFTVWAGSYEDILFDPQANETAAEFLRERIRETVKDPKVAELLCPRPGTAFGTRRQPCDTEYYETFNRANVTLVDIHGDPVDRLTETALRTRSGKEYELDALIYATGFDAFRGSLYRMNIVGKDGERLEDHWQNGPQTYLGLAMHGFPNFFTITGPMSPSVLFNMPLGIEQHCEWITDCIEFMRRKGFAEIEADRDAEDQWIAETKAIADQTLMATAESWYTGANIPGKPRVFMVYLGGGRRYKQICDDIAAAGYGGFTLRKQEQQALASAVA